MSDKPIVIEITRPGQSFPVGAEIGVESLDAAQTAYPGAKAVRYQDGTAYVVPEPVKSSKADSPKREMPAIKDEDA